MPDVHDKLTRSRNMSAIRGKNTRPEMLVRKALYQRGFRYRLHDKKLPGKPDLVFRQRNAVVFVHGCFWHRHDCPAFKLPTERREFWRAKIASNVLRDRLAVEKLANQGWRTACVWECSLKSKHIDCTIERIVAWLESDEMHFMG